MPMDGPMHTTPDWERDTKKADVWHRHGFISTPTTLQVAQLLRRIRWIHTVPFLAHAASRNRLELITAW